MRARPLGCTLIGFVAAAIGAAIVSDLAVAQTAGAPECRTCGRVVSIRTSSTVDRWEPLGGSAGSAAADIGGPGSSMQPTAVSSYQFRGGSQKGMVLLGSAGGANYKKSSTSYERKIWDVTVELDSGETRSVSMRYEPFVREGDRVRIAGNNLELVD